MPHVLGPAGAPPPNPCPPLDGTIGALDRIADACPVCWALVPTNRLAQHIQWHEEEADRVERALLA